MPVDPLDGIESYPPRTQMALVISELRNTRAMMARISRQQWWILTTLVGLLTLLIGGLSLVILQGGKP